jgi:predicted RNase H-like HicB family nuclease
MATERFLMVIREAEGTYSAYSPDVPGCIATGSSKDAVATTFAGLLEKHLLLLFEKRRPRPMPSEIGASYIQVSVPEGW